MPTMPRHILIIQGHPDAGGTHFCHALAAAYRDGAMTAGHHVRTLDIGTLDFALLRSQADWEHGQLPANLVPAQADIAWAEHLVLLFPLWLGDMPALVKGFLEQVARPGFAFKSDGPNPFAHKGLAGRSARIVVTMGMPALLYRWYFRAHSVKSLERNILGFVGIAPIEHTLIGGVGAMKAPTSKAWLARLGRLGQAAV
jgi:putative NADPH-quinone reductase